MAGHLLAEYTVTMIRDYLKTNMPAALATVRTERGDALVTTPPPKKYFLYAPAKGYEVPAIFIICPKISLRNKEMGANFIAGQAEVIVSCLIEDRLKESLVFKSWRYQAALNKLLHITSLTSTDGRVTLKIKVEELHYGPEFTDKDPASAEMVFRKEIALRLEVEHNENL